MAKTRKIRGIETPGADTVPSVRYWSGEFARRCRSADRGLRDAQEVYGQFKTGLTALKGLNSTALFLRQVSLNVNSRRDFNGNLDSGREERILQTSRNFSDLLFRRWPEVSTVTEGYYSVADAVMEDAADNVQTAEDHLVAEFARGREHYLAFTGSYVDLARQEMARAGIAYEWGPDVASPDV